MMCPQHGSIFKGDHIKRFLYWFEAFEVGIGKVIRLFVQSTLAFN
jgi:flavorubredoxin